MRWCVLLLLAPSGCAGTAMMMGKTSLKPVVQRIDLPPSATSSETAITHVQPTFEGPVVSFEYSGECVIQTEIRTTELTRASGGTTALIAVGATADVGLIGFNGAALALHDDPSEVTPWLLGAGAVVTASTVVGSLLLMRRNKRGETKSKMQTEERSEPCRSSEALRPEALQLMPARDGHEGWPLTPPSGRDLVVPPALMGQAILLSPSPAVPRIHLSITEIGGQDAIQSVGMDQAAFKRFVWDWACLASQDTPLLPATALGTHRKTLEVMCPQNLKGAVARVCASEAGADPDEIAARSTLCSP